jgi:hypothetical protein
MFERTPRQRVGDWNFVVVRIQPVLLVGKVGKLLRGLLQKSWQHYFSEISKASTGISKFAAERQQRLISNDAAR